MSEKDVSVRGEKPLFSLLSYLALDIMILWFSIWLFFEPTVRMVSAFNNDAFFVAAGIVGAIGMVAIFGPSIVKDFTKLFPKKMVHPEDESEMPLDELFESMGSKGEFGVLQGISLRAKKIVVLNWGLVVIGLVLIIFSSTWKSVDETLLYIFSIMGGLILIIKALFFIKLGNLKISLINEITKRKENSL